MRQNKRIAVTGGIGSGKSTVCAALKKYGFPVFSCDEVYRELQREKSFLEGLKKIFPSVVTKEGLDKKALSAIVFSDSSALEKLNAYTHPRIMERVFERMDGFSLAFAEVPLLFEANLEGEFDGVLVVMRKAEDRLAAVCARDGVSEAAVRDRIKNQFDYENNLKSGHTVIYNDGDKDSLERKVWQYLKKING